MDTHESGHYQNYLELYEFYENTKNSSGKVKFLSDCNYFAKDLKSSLNLKNPLPAWMNNHMLSELWDEIIDPFPTSTVQWSLGVDK